MVIVGKPYSSSTIPIRRRACVPYRLETGRS